LLGPLNYNLNPEPEWPDFFSEKDKLKELDRIKAGRDMQTEWEERKSGAMYRGEVASLNDKPDGRGIKVFQSDSVYEGFFQNGTCHGYGRAISSKGEIY